jgi:hypothetical protein
LISTPTPYRSIRGPRIDQYPEKNKKKTEKILASFLASERLAPIIKVTPKMGVAPKMGVGTGKNRKRSLTRARLLSLRQRGEPKPGLLPRSLFLLKQRNRKKKEIPAKSIGRKVSLNRIGPIGNLLVSLEEQDR